MSDDTKVYISVESSSGRLIVDGSMALWRELVGCLGATPVEPTVAAQNVRPATRQPAERVSEPAR